MIGLGSDEIKENVNKKGVCENLNNLSVGLCNDRLFLFPRGRNSRLIEKKVCQQEEFLKEFV